MAYTNIPDRLSHLGQIIDISINFYTSEKTVPDTWLNNMNLDSLETIYVILPVKTRQFPVSVVTKHEESDLGLFIYADKTI